MISEKKKAMRKKSKKKGKKKVTKNSNGLNLSLLKSVLKGEE